jgi:hypothetical protein
MKVNVKKLARILMAIGIIFPIMEQITDTYIITILKHPDSVLFSLGLALWFSLDKGRQNER